jgi:formylglycine-generating enzyme required for sulfatase activity
MRKCTLRPILFVSLAFFISSCNNESKNPTGSGNPEYTISGRVLESGAGLSGVAVHLTGSGKDPAAVTSSAGDYKFTNISDGTYTVTPGKTGYTFTPASATVAVNGANTVIPDFTAIRSITPTPYEYKGIVFVSIPDVAFQMGDETGDLMSACRPVHTVTISEFEIGVYEITNAHYAKFLNEAKATGDITLAGSTVKGAKGTYSGFEYMYLLGSYNENNKCWITYSANQFSVASGKENWPVVFVTWYGAKAFALYYGLDLPTEAEWEYVARGGRQYKYGTNDGTISSANANYGLNIGSPKEVGGYPPNPLGLYDLCGNVWEWCHDWFGPYQDGGVSNPSGPQTGSFRIARGGSWFIGGDYCRTADRNHDSPITGAGSMGFRVVHRANPLNY